MLGRFQVVSQNMYPPSWLDNGGCAAKLQKSFCQAGSHPFLYRVIAFFSIIPTIESCHWDYLSRDEMQQISIIPHLDEAFGESSWNCGVWEKVTIRRGFGRSTRTIFLLISILDFWRRAAALFDITAQEPMIYRCIPYN